MRAIRKHERDKLKDLCFICSKRRPNWSLIHQKMKLPGPNGRGCCFGNLVMTEDCALLDGEYSCGINGVEIADLLPEILEF